MVYWSSCCLYHGAVECLFAVDTIDCFLGADEPPSCGFRIVAQQKILSRATAAADDVVGAVAVAVVLSHATDMAMGTIDGSVDVKYAMLAVDVPIESPVYLGGASHALGQMTWALTPDVASFQMTAWIWVTTSAIEAAEDETWDVIEIRKLLIIHIVAVGTLA